MDVAFLLDKYFKGAKKVSIDVFDAQTLNTVYKDVINDMTSHFGIEISILQALSIFREGELEEASNMQILHNTLSKYKPTKVYNLNVIISVGYRVKSKRGTQFRIWATGVLKDFILRGYAFNQRMRLMKEELDTRLNQQQYGAAASSPLN